MVTTCYDEKDLEIVFPLERKKKIEFGRDQVKGMVYKGSSNKPNFG